ncbi:putative glycosyltransferase [Bacillus sp. TS-2]|nr:putative glycosyltransferase [Bacillus sp. TS-2]
MKNHSITHTQNLTQTASNNPIQLLQGTIEIANQMYTISKGFQETNVQPSTINYYPTYLNYSSQYELVGKWKDFSNLDVLKKYIQNELIPHFDIFHFHFSTSLLPNHSDLELINQTNKPIFMHHWGSDIRDLSKALEINPYAKAKVTDPSYIEETLKDLSKNIRHCIVADHELRRYVKDYYENVYMIPTSVDLNMYKVLEHENHKPLIVHAPTNYEIKGSQTIINTISKLQSEFDFNFKLITGMSHEEAKSLYQQADIIVDQIHVGCYGLFAVECMALGKPVVCHISDYMLDHYPEDLPIISANPDTIYMKLKKLLQNQDEWKEIAKKSRQYAIKYHDHIKNGLKLLNIYQDVLSEK